MKKNDSRTFEDVLREMFNEAKGEKENDGKRKAKKAD